MTKRQCSRSAMTISLLMFVAMPAFAQIQTQQQGAVTFASGGVGREERAEIETMSANFNLRIVTTLKSGHLLSHVHVTIKTNDGQVVLDTSTDGPILLAKLSPGAYVVTCDSLGVSQTRTISIAGESQRRITCSWAD